MFFIEEYLHHLQESRYSFKTIKHYENLLSHFKDYLLQQGISDIKVISQNEPNHFLNFINKRNISGREYYIRVRRLISYFQYLEENGFIFLSPLKKLASPKFSKKSFPILDEKRIEHILENVKTDWPLCVKGKAIIELAYSSALRPREIYNLKITDIDFKKGLLFIEQSKNQKDRIVPVGKEALFWVEKYITEIRPRYKKHNTHNYVFISHKTGEKLTVWGIRWAIQETLRLNGMQPIKQYSLRSTAATALLLNGMSIAYISKLLGHVDIRTTQIYLNVKLKDLKKEISQKHPRATFYNHQNKMEEVHENEV